MRRPRRGDSVRIRTRLLLALAYVLILAIVSLEVPLALTLRDRVNSEVRSQARGEADVVAASAADLLQATTGSRLAVLVRRAAAEVRGRVLVVDRRGTVLADSSTPSAVGLDYGRRPEIAAALAGRGFQDRRRSRTLAEEILATAVPVIRGGRPAGAVRITQSVAAVHRATARAVVALAVLGVLVLALGLVAGSVIAEQLARPLRRLRHAAARIAGGDLEARARVEGSEEQRSLARSFNEMTERLTRLLRSQQDFVADASHQLRTPLTALRLRLEEAHAQVGHGNVRTDLEAGLREADRMADMIDELLVLSRAGERELPGEQIGLDEAVRRAADRWTPIAAEQGVRLRAIRNGSAGRAWCAVADFDRAFDALIDNAVRYSSSGDEVELAAAGQTVEVRDRGPGVGEADEARVFERFHRGRAGREGPPGTGLGLPIARELAEEWGGSASLLRRAGGGTIAVLRFPASGGVSR